MGNFTFDAGIGFGYRLSLADETSEYYTMAREYLGLKEDQELTAEYLRERFGDTYPELYFANTGTGEGDDTGIVVVIGSTRVNLSPSGQPAVDNKAPRFGSWSLPLNNFSYEAEQQMYGFLEQCCIDEDPYLVAWNSVR